MSELKHEVVSHCQVPGSLCHVAEAANSLRDFCERRLIDASLWPTIELAFCEALNNAIEHGCNENESLIVRILWKWEAEWLTIEIEDPGNWPATNEGTSLPENPLDESGRGCFIVDSVFDQTDHHSTQYGHKFVLKKQLHHPYSAVEKLQETYASLQSTVGNLNRSYAHAIVIQGLATDLATIPFPNDFISKGIERIRTAADLPQVEIWMLEENKLRNYYSDGPDTFGLSKRIIDPQGKNPFAAVLKEQCSHIISDCSTLLNKNCMYSTFEFAYLEPIVYQSESLGVIAIRYSQKDSANIESHTADLIQVLAQFAAIAFANAATYNQRKEHERTETQLEVASEIQRSLLPSKFPDNEHCRLTGKCVTALAVGGDYIDAIEIRDQGLLLIIADVMGKGVPAALLATIFRTAIRSRLNLAETPGWLLSKIDEQFHEELGHLNMFITAQAAYFSYEKKTLKLSSAGHCPAFLTKADGAQEELTAEGIPLGINPTNIYEERIVNLSAGDRVLFITDGIYETENEAGEMLGIEGFSKRLPEIWNDGLDAVPNKALAVVAQHSHGDEFQDDKTLMALEVL
ncbi:MAG: SpoIIE family protein phosphatase [Opitutaceae bacterium]|nr:SpoIIE family protein phosphatase [Opitutaceae bacterium]